MRRRDLLALFAGGTAIAWSVVDRARAADKLWHIGFLDGGSDIPVRRARLDAFRRHMAELGYVEGRNIAYEVRFAGDQFERLPELAGELLAHSSDALLVATTPAAAAVKAVTATTPTVIVAVADPVGTGLVQSLARPGGNITGFTNIGAELAGKRLQIIKEMVPAAARVAVLINPDDPNAESQLRHAEEAAHKLQLELKPIAPIRRPADSETAVAAAVAAGAGAAIRMVDSVAVADTIDAAARHRLPVVYPFPFHAEAGGLVSYGTDLTGQFVQAADLIDKILKGAKPADLPVEQPTKFELVVNLKTAKALGLSVSQSLLARADEVIE